MKTRLGVLLLALSAAGCLHKPLPEPASAEYEDSSTGIKSYSTVWTSSPNGTVPYPDDSLRVFLHSWSAWSADVVRHSSSYSPQTGLSFKVPHTSPVSFKFASWDGRIVTRAITDTLETGKYVLTLGPPNILPSGAYIWQYRVGDSTTTRKFLIMR